MKQVLIVGGGSIGERHLRCFQQVLASAGGRVAICEPLDRRRQELAERYQLEQSFASLDEAARQRWHAAVICTPANLHVPHALQLAPVCDGLLIEKPLATQLDDARRLAAALAGKTVGAAYVWRTHPAAQLMRQALDEGKLGRLLQVVVVSGQHFPTFRPAYREIYYARRETGGGAIQDALTHMANLVEYLAGPLEWVWCDYAHQALPGVEVEDTAHLQGRTGGGQVMVSIALNQFMAPSESSIQLNGELGSMVLKTSTQRLGTFLRGDSDWSWTEPLLQERDDLFRRQAQWFLDAVAQARPPVCTLEQAMQTLRVNLAALESAGRQRIDVVQG